MFTAAEEKLRNGGISLWLAGLNPGVLTVVQRSKLGETLGRERMLFNLQAAVERYERTGSAPKSAAADSQAQVSSTSTDNTEDWS
jgi:hypothetical protein